MNLRMDMLALTMATLVVIALGCSDDAAPGECIDAARDAGVPDAVVNWMKEPTDELGPVERIAIREALERFGLGDTCATVGDSLGFSLPEQVVDRNGDSQDSASPRTVEDTETPQSSDSVPEQRNPALPQAKSTPRPPATPNPPDTPVPSYTPTPTTGLSPMFRRFSAGQSDYLFPEYEGEYPEAIGVAHVGTAGNPDGRFVIVFDEPVYAERHGEIRLRVITPDWEEIELSLRTRTSRSRPSHTLEFGPVDENLTRAYRLENYSYLQDSDGNSVTSGEIGLINHPNSLFVGGDYGTAIQDKLLVRCAGLLEFNRIAPIIVRSLRVIASTAMSDAERFEWLVTLRAELEDADSGSDQIRFDDLLLWVHPCAPLWAEEVDSSNASKRNDQWSCTSEDPDVSDLLSVPYLDLDTSDRILLKWMLGGWASEACRYHYPQLYFNLWIPLEE